MWFTLTTVAVTAPERADRRVPLVIPRSQLYYWSSKWQRDEREALAELARGEGRSFETTQEAIKWLLSNDDDE